MPTTKENRGSTHKIMDELYKLTFEFQKAWKAGNMKEMKKIVEEQKRWIEEYQGLMRERYAKKPRHAAVEARAAWSLRGREEPTAHVGGRRREPFRAER